MIPFAHLLDSQCQFDESGAVLAFIFGRPGPKQRKFFGLRTMFKSRAA